MPAETDISNLISHTLGSGFRAGDAAQVRDVLAHLMPQFFHLGERIAERLKGVFHVNVAVGYCSIDLLPGEHRVREDDVFDDGTNAAEFSSVN
jgi:hypothetical protein